MKNESFEYEKMTENEIFLIIFTFHTFSTVYHEKKILLFKK